MSDKAMERATAARVGPVASWSEAEWRVHREGTQRAVAAYLDALCADLPEEAVEAARAHEQRGQGRDRIAVIDTEQSIRRFLLSLRGSLPAGTRGDDDR